MLILINNIPLTITDDEGHWGLDVATEAIWQGRDEYAREFEREEQLQKCVDHHPWHRNVVRYQVDLSLLQDCRVEDQDLVHVQQLQQAVQRFVRVHWVLEVGREVYVLRWELVAQHDVLEVGCGFRKLDFVHDAADG